MAEKRESKKTQAVGPSTEQAVAEVQTVENLLTPEERVVLGQVSASGAPHGQRALVLLALDEGATQSAAAEQAGLSPGQVRYWRDKFLDRRLGIFPDELLPSDDQGPEAAASEVDEEPQEEAGALQEQVESPKAKKAKGEKKDKKGKGKKKAKDEKKKKKDKKKKGKKKAKKPKKGKKSKKDKKSKKAKGKGGKK